MKFFFDTIFVLGLDSKKYCINPLASPSAGAPALKYGDVNTVNPSPGEVKGLMEKFQKILEFKIIL